VKLRAPVCLADSLAVEEALMLSRQRFPSELPTDCDRYWIDPDVSASRKTLPS